jgi:hypothetical protein
MLQTQKLGDKIMTPKQHSEYLKQSQAILDDIDFSKKKIRAHEQSLRGYPGIAIPGTLRHDIEISQAVIIRLNTRLDRLKFKFGL